jgi:hypothetical protein
MKKILKILVLLYFVLIVFNSNIFALDFQINKGKVRIKLPPGWSDGGTIKVDNKGQEPINIRVYAADWIYTAQDGSKNFLPPGTDPKSCTDWIKFYPADFTLPPAGSKEVNYVIAVPSDAVGGHYAVLFFEVEVGSRWDETKDVAVRVYNRVASLFYVEPEGTIERKAAINDFQLRHLADALEIQGVFVNTGNVDITAKGSYDLIDKDGFVFTRGEFKEIYTMPQDKANLFAKGEAVKLAAGSYDLILTLDLEGEILVKEYAIEVSDAGEVVGVKEIE